MFAKDFTIIVPTYRRSHFLARMIGGLNEMGFGGQLFLADSSEPQEFKVIDDLIAKLSPAYHIEHISVPKAPGMPLPLSLNHAIAVASQRVTTPYVTMTCDDDIPVPATLEKAGALLNVKPDVLGVLGDHVFLMLNDRLNRADYGPGNVEFVGEYHATFEIMRDTAQERLAYFFDHYCNTMFLMTRTEQFREFIPPESFKIQYPHFSAEYMWMFTPVMMGKIAVIDDLQVVRQKHASNISNSVGADPERSVTEVLLRPEWHRDANLFVDHLTRHIANADDISVDEASSFAKIAFGHMMALKLLEAMGRVKQNDPRVKQRSPLYRAPGSPENKLFHECVCKIMQFDITEPFNC